VQRTREVGIRVALGAPPAGVVWELAREGAATAAAGICCGAAIAWTTSSLFRHLLFGVEPHDLLTLASTSLLLLIVATAAAILPAIRAASVDPLAAIRAE
jgi:putative ABC transport system permease protein